MSILPEHIRLAFADREGPAIFATVDPAGAPNAAYVGEDQPLALSGVTLHVLPAGYGFDPRKAQIFTPEDRSSME